MITYGSADYLIAAALLLFTCVLSQDVRLPPDITSHSEKFITFRPDEKNLELSCYYTGYPEPDIEWMKNNRTLDLNSGNIQVLDGGRKIQIVSAYRPDEGSYQCFVSNQNGKAMSDISKLQMADMGSFTDVETLNYAAMVGEPVTLACTGAPESVPAATFTWSSVVDREDTSPQVILLSKRIQIDDQGNLRFAYVLKSDEIQHKLYKCNLRNSVMDVLKGGSYSKLFVNDSGAAVPDFKPTIMFSSPTTVTGLVSNNITLRCFFSAKPDASITWKKEGGSLPAGRWEQMSSNSALLLKNLVPSDAGSYVCQGANSQGFGQNTIKLVIESVPVFDSIEDKVHNKNVTAGESVTMRCAATGTPTPSVTWYTNTEPLNPDALPQNYRLSTDMLNLTIVNVCKVCNPSSLAVIQCRASNTHGSAFSQGYINVLVDTKILDQPTLVQYEPGLNFVFPCSATTDESTPLSYQWFFRASASDYEDRIIYDSHVYFDEATSELHVRTGNDSDMGLGRVGDYRCEVSNGVSTASVTHSYVNPTAPDVATRILDQSITEQYEPGLNFVFPCTAATDESTPLSYQWFFRASASHDEDRITYDSSIYFDETISELQVKTGNDSDMGLGRVGYYRCEVNNGVSTASLIHAYVNPTAPDVQATRI